MAGVQSHPKPGLTFLRTKAEGLKKEKDVSNRDGKKVLIHFQHKGEGISVTALHLRAVRQTDLNRSGSKQFGLHSLQYRGQDPSPPKMNRTFFY